MSARESLTARHQFTQSAEVASIIFTLRGTREGSYDEWNVGVNVGEGTRTNTLKKGGCCAASRALSNSVDERGEAGKKLSGINWTRRR